MRITLLKIAQEMANIMSLKRHNTMVYRIITENDYKMIVGLVVEPCRFSSDFSVHTFIQPLYIPYHLITLSLGERVKWWKREDFSTAISEIQQNSRELSYDSITAIVNAMIEHKLMFAGCDTCQYECYAYSCLVVERFDLAKTYLDKIVAFENENSVKWEKEVIGRAKKLLSLMYHGKLMEIRTDLLHIQKEEIRILKLPEQ